MAAFAVPRRHGLTNSGGGHGAARRDRPDSSARQSGERAAPVRAGRGASALAADCRRDRGTGRPGGQPPARCRRFGRSLPHDQGQSAVRGGECARRGFVRRHRHAAADPRRHHRAPGATLRAGLRTGRTGQRHRAAPSRSTCSPRPPTGTTTACRPRWTNCGSAASSRGRARRRVAAYDFTHDRLREVTYAELSPVRRRFLHRRIARALEELHAATLESVSGQLAAHYEAAGMAEPAIRPLRECGGRGAPPLRRCRGSGICSGARWRSAATSRKPSGATTGTGTAGHARPRAGDHAGLQHAGGRRTLRARAAALPPAGRNRARFCRLERSLGVPRGARPTGNLPRIGAGMPGPGKPARVWRRTFRHGAFHCWAAASFIWAGWKRSKDASGSGAGGLHAAVPTQPWRCSPDPMSACSAGPISRMCCGNWGTREEAAAQERGSARRGPPGVASVQSGDRPGLCGDAARLPPGHCSRRWTRAEEAAAVCRKHGFAYYLSVAEILAAGRWRWPAMRRPAWRGSGTGWKPSRRRARSCACPSTMGLLAEACGRAGQMGEALANISNGFAFQSKNGEVWAAAGFASHPWRPAAAQGETSSRRGPATSGRSRRAAAGARMFELAVPSARTAERRSSRERFQNAPAN